MHHAPSSRPLRGTPRRVVAGAAAGLLLAMSACGSDDGGRPSATAGAAGGDRSTIVVTTPILGAVVSDIAGDVADVRVLMPNGIDPHEWEPSAKDIAAVQSADLVVENGLHLEESLEDALDEARDAGVPIFTASDHIDVRVIGDGEIPEHADEDDHAAEDEHADEDEHGHDDVGADDPHLWMDPATMALVAAALGDELVTLGLDVTAAADAEVAALASLDAQIEEILAVVPADDRMLVTGHESLGYFARRYDFTVVGAVVPSVSSQAESSAGELAALTDQIEATGVRAIFTELGAPADVVDAIADETGAVVVELGTHALPDDGAYSTFMVELATKVAAALAPAT